MRTSEYESLVLEGFRRILIEPGSQAANLARRGETRGGVRVERVYLDESGPEHEIAILSRDLIVGVTACSAEKSGNYSFKPIDVERSAATITGRAGPLPVLWPSLALPWRSPDGPLAA